MIQTLTVTTKGEVYWSVEVDDAEEERPSEMELENFHVMERRAKRLQAVLHDPNDHANQGGRKVGKIIS